MPEKVINEISADARRLFTKANEAAQRENGDYAIALYCQVLEKDPALLNAAGCCASNSKRKPPRAAAGSSKK